MINRVIESEVETCKERIKSEISLKETLQTCLTSHLIYWAVKTSNIKNEDLALERRSESKRRGGLFNKPNLLARVVAKLEDVNFY